MKSLQIYKNLKILITGSTGFKGSWLCFWLNNLNANVVGIGLRPEKDSIIFKALDLHKKIKQIYLDINNFNKLNEIIKKEKPDLIFHLAAQSIVSLGYKQPLQTIETNVLGSANILEACRRNKINNLVYITSDKCYLNKNFSSGYRETDALGGFDNYSSSKAAAEIIFSSYFNCFFKGKKISAVSARAGNVIGGGDFKQDRIIPDVIKSMSSKKNIVVRNPNSIRPWQHVLESLSGYLLLGNYILNRRLDSKLIPSWNFGPKNSSYKKVIYVVKKTVSAWGYYHKKININKNKSFFESEKLFLNIDKAKKELNWIPSLNLEQTIDLTVAWYKNYFADNNMSFITQDQINFFSDVKK